MIGPISDYDYWKLSSPHEDDREEDFPGEDAWDDYEEITETNGER